jgi:3-isopropylmalate/(R)-2-methylmalate dehydratase large subunit
MVSLSSVGSDLELPVAATATAKILRAHGITDTTPGSFGLARCDLVLLNEVSGAVAIPAFARMGAERVFDPKRVALVADHFVPAKDARSAELVRTLRQFAADQGIDQYWEVGATLDAGIEHTLLPELGLVRPGDLIPGGDSHTCTYGAFGALGLGMGSSDIASALALGEVWLRMPEVVRVRYSGTPSRLCTGKDLILALLAEVGVSGATYAALEFEGPAVSALSIDGRMALCNMAVEAGAKTCLVAADSTTLEWVSERVTDGPVVATVSDPDAVYDRTIDLDVDGMGCVVARPPSPGDVQDIRDLPGGISVDQVYVGNCSNGTLTDLRQLCEVLSGRTVARGTRLIVVPATQRIYRQAVAEGLVDTILAAGGMLSPPTCGACFGGHMGILAEGETAVATTNRNFKGRMGHPGSQVFLANAYVAGAAAVTGELVDPAGLLE